MLTDSVILLDLALLFMVVGFDNIIILCLLHELWKGKKK